MADEDFCEDEQQVQQLEEEEAPPPKRARVSKGGSSSSKSAWSIPVLNWTALRDQVLILKDLLPVIAVVVRITPEFRGLCVNAMHSSTAYIIKSSCETHVEGPASCDGEAFCVDSASLSNILRRIKSDAATVSLVLNPTNHKLKFGVDGPTTRDTYELDTLDNQQPALEVPNLKFRYCADIDRASFLGFCSYALASKATLVRLTMKKPTRPRPGENVIFLTLTAKGDNVFTRREFFSCTSAAGSSSDPGAVDATDKKKQQLVSISVIEPAARSAWTEDYGELETAFDRQFGIKILELLLKNVESKTVRVMMSPDDKMPLNVHIPMGGSASFINALLAYAVRGDEDEDPAAAGSGGDDE
jgi:hypothetical protein